MTRLGLVTQLLERIRLKSFRLCVVRICENEMIDHFGNPAVITFLISNPCLLKHRVGSTHEVDIPDRGVFRRQRMHVRRIAVEIAQVFLIHSTGIVTHGAVVAAVVPNLPKFGRQLQLL